MEKTILGITFALLSTASWAVCSIIFKKLGEKLEPVGMTCVKSLLSFIYLFIAIVITRTDLLINKEVLIPLLG